MSNSGERVAFAIGARYGFHVGCSGTFFIGFLTAIVFAFAQRSIIMAGLAILCFLIGNYHVGCMMRLHRVVVKPYELEVSDDELKVIANHVNALKG